MRLMTTILALLFLAACGGGGGGGSSNEGPSGLNPGPALDQGVSVRLVLQLQVLANGDSLRLALSEDRWNECCGLVWLTCGMGTGTVFLESPSGPCVPASSAS